jgi:dGTPase
MEWNKVLSTYRFRDSERLEAQKKDENNKYYDQRTDFESDLGRVVFSPAVRRMHDKTQVFPLTSDDNIHTRLTHSMEVQSVAQSLGINLCNREDFIKRFGVDKIELIRNIPAILSAVSLCHDIGNPPFGHFGEDVIGYYFKQFFDERKNQNPPLQLTEAQQKDFTLFNGNAQGFRVLTRLQLYKDIYGLNLCAGTLSAFLKYPNTSEAINEKPSKEEKKQKGYKNKLGVFQSEKILLDTIREKTGLTSIRNPLAFLMEAADSICYNVMDIEDGFNKHLYDFESILKFLENNGDESVKELICSFRAGLEKRLTGINDENAKIIMFRTSMLQELVNQAVRNFVENIEAIEKGEFTAELIYLQEKGLGKTLKEFCTDRIFKNREIQTLEITGESVIKGLLKHFVNDFIDYKAEDSPCASRAEKLYSLISNSITLLAQEQSEKEKALYKMSDYYKLRMIVDYISGMTDSFALNLYQKLEGIKIG